MNGYAMAGAGIGFGAAFVGNVLDHGTNPALPRSPWRIVGAAVAPVTGGTHVRSGEPWNVLAGGAAAALGAGALLARGDARSAGMLALGGAAGIAVAEVGHQLLHHVPGAWLADW